jgi:hypothetical protein
MRVRGSGVSPCATDAGLKPLRRLRASRRYQRQSRCLGGRRRPGVTGFAGVSGTRGKSAEGFLATFGMTMRDSGALG